MKVSEFPLSGFLRRIETSGVWLRTGPFTTRLRVEIDAAAQAIYKLYGDFSLDEREEFADFHVRIARPRNLRRWYRPQAFFYFDGETPFAPLPVGHAFAMFEWCLNWSIETHGHHYLIIHAAVVEQGGEAAILAAPPASGKSTLTAGLVLRGWRLLSDELALIDPKTGFLVPLSRPVGLKNESIDVIRDFAPDAVIGPVASDTTKGTVAHLKPPRESVRRMNEPARGRWVIFPRYEAGSETVLTPYSKATALLRLGDNAFNYSQLGLRGFETLSSLIDRSSCYEFAYSDLNEACRVFDSLTAPLGRADEEG